MWGIGKILRSSLVLRPIRAIRVGGKSLGTSAIAPNKLGNEVGRELLGMWLTHVRSRNEKTTKKCKTYLKPAFMIV